MTRTSWPHFDGSRRCIAIHKYIIEAPDDVTVKVGRAEWKTTIGIIAYRTYTLEYQIVLNRDPQTKVRRLTETKWQFLIIVGFVPRCRDKCSIMWLLAREGWVLHPLDTNNPYWVGSTSIYFFCFAPILFFFPSVDSPNVSTEVCTILLLCYLSYFTYYIPYQSSGLLQVLYKYTVDSPNISTESSGLLQDNEGH